MRSITASFALFALPIVHAVSLADLVPRAENLPQACNALYTAQIPGCTSTDFSTHDCTQSCINSLFSLVKPIKEACGNQGITGKNLIVAYLAGVGPEQICQNAKQPSGSISSFAVPTTTSQKSTITKGVLTITSIPAGDSSSIAGDTSTAPKPKPTTSPKSDSGSSALPSQLNTHDHSGGGSPFDTAGNLSSGAMTLSLSAVVALLSTVALLFANVR